MSKCDPRCPLRSPVHERVTVILFFIRIHLKKFFFIGV